VIIMSEDIIKQEIVNDDVIEPNPEITESMKIHVSNETDRLVSGWASVEVVDKDNDILPISVLKSAMIKYMKRGGDVHFAHSIVKVGKVVQWEIMKHPETGKWGVYIVAQIFDDYATDNAVWNAIKEGKLTAFSIGGKGKSREVLKDDTVIREFEHIEISEISIVSSPRNPHATIEEVSLAKGQIELNYEDILKSLDCAERFDDFMVMMNAINGNENVSKIVDIYKDVVHNILCSNASNEAKVDVLLDVMKSLLVVVSLGEEKEMRDIKKEDTEGIDISAKVNNCEDAVDCVYEAVGEKREDVIGLKAKVEELVNLIKAKVSKEKYMEGNHFKEMTCPDDPQQKSRFCGCVRYMMATGKSLESAKRICAYIKHYVKKGDDYYFVVDVFGDELELSLAELEVFVDEIEKAKEMVKGKFRRESDKSE